MINNNKNKTAVFIDGSWLYTAQRLLRKRIDYGKLRNALLKIFGDTTTIYFFGILPETKQQEKFYISLKKTGYTICLTQAKRIGNQLKVSGVDINLVVKAMSILSQMEKLILISGDSDFTPLLEIANSIGIDTLVVALPHSIAYVLHKTAKTFLNLETLIDGRQNIKLKLRPEKRKTNITPPNLFKGLFVDKGDHYKSYINFRNLLKSAKNSIIRIDPYENDEFLSMIPLLNKEIDIILFTEKKYLKPVDFCTQVKKLRQEGYIIKVLNTKTFHDRYIKIDNKWLSMGASSKDYGKRVSTILPITLKNIISGLEKNIIKENNDSQEICK